MKLTSQRQGQREMRDVFVFSSREDKVVWKAYFLEEMAEKCAKMKSLTRLSYREVEFSSACEQALLFAFCPQAVFSCFPLLREEGSRTYIRVGTRGSFTRACLACAGLAHGFAAQSTCLAVSPLAKTSKERACRGLSPCFFFTCLIILSFFILFSPFHCI